MHGLLFTITLMRYLYFKIEFIDPAGAQIWRYRLRLRGEI